MPAGVGRCGPFSDAVGRSRTRSPVTFRSAPPAARAVAGGVALEGLLLGGYAVVVVVETVRGEAKDRIGALVLAVVALLLAAGLVAVANGILGGRRWARSPALVWQLL